MAHQNHQPKNELHELLTQRGMESIATKFINENINLTFEQISGVDESDINELCQTLQLSIDEKIKFKKFIREINNENSNLMNGNYIVNPTNEQLKNRKFDFTITTILLGDSGAGKTCIFNRMSNNRYDECQSPTIGIDYNIVTLMTPNSQKIKVSIWDTAGQERMDSLTQGYYKSADCVIIVYDITDKLSFDKAIKIWAKRVMEKSTKCVYIALVGNKIDREKEREVTTQDGMNIAKDNNWGFFEVSAKLGSHIKSLIVTSSIQTVMMKQKRRINKAPYRSDSIDLRRKSQKKEKTKACCD